MNDKKEFAYPSNANENIKEGLTKREYFAAKAMQGFITKQNNGSINFEHLSDAAIMAADALIKALEK